ncbi:hypothetical protein K474DRAFT_1659972 [Panus rudis PR-1116 ss-1]|nr:hypothetical protein K474DRAFT_1659972 [Panus rudis PR-1116 ss-1]
MKTVSSLAVLAVMAASAAAQGPMINTPEGVIVCQPLLLTWSGGTPPYFLSILPGGQPSAAPLEQFTDLQTTSFTWKVDQPAGTSLGLTIRDSTGASGQSAPFDVHSGRAS